MTAMRRKAGLVLGLSVLLIALAWAARALGWPVSDTARGVLAGVGASGLLGALLLRWSPEPCDTGTPALRRRYLHEFLPAMLAYVLVLFASAWLLKRVEDPAWLRALLALAPAAPIAWALRAIVRHIRDIDEMQQRIELEAISVATALVSMLYLAGGFLQLAGVIAVPAGVAMIWVFPLICLGYGLARILVARRYA